MLAGVPIPQCRRATAAMTTTAPVPTQQEMLFQSPSISDPDHYFATRLISQVQRELQRSNRKVMMIVSRWMIAFEYLKSLEERVMMNESPMEREKVFLKGTVAVMLGLGRHLLFQVAEHDDAIVKNLGFSYSDLEACVSELEDIERSASREWSESEKESLEALLG
jgi:hypothetical protein